MKAVMVVDMVNDFVTGKLGSPRTQKLVPRLKAFLERARSKGVLVIYVSDAHRPGDSELRVWGDHSMKGSEGARIVDELSPERGDLVFEKQWYDGFQNPTLDVELKKRGIDELLMTGVATNICVQNTAAEASFKGYDVAVVEDCTEAPSEEDHRQGLKYMKTMYGARVVSSDEAL